LDGVGVMAGAMASSFLRRRAPYVHPIGGHSQSGGTKATVGRFTNYMTSGAFGGYHSPLGNFGPKQPQPAKAAPAPGAPAQPQPPQQPGAPQGGADFIPDSEYTTSLAQSNFDANQRLAQLEQQGSYDKTDLGTSLARLRAQQPKDEQSTSEGAANQGLFYSGILGQRLGDVRTRYQQREGDLQQSSDRKQAALEAAKAAIREGMPLTEAALRAQAVDRNVGRDQTAAESDSLVPDPTTPPPAAAGVAAGFHAGHSRGHEYYLPGVGWVSADRFKAGQGKKTQ
jgi:hypothetical protein